MARLTTARVIGFLVAAPLAATLLLAGAGAAQAANGAGADHSSNSNATSDTGTADVFGPLDGNYNWTQQSATGPGALNLSNTLGVKDNDGIVNADQANHNVSIIFSSLRR